MMATWASPRTTSTAVIDPIQKVCRATRRSDGEDTRLTIDFNRPIAACTNVTTNGFPGSRPQLVQGAAPRVTVTAGIKAGLGVEDSL